MAITVICIYLVALLFALVWTTRDLGAAGVGAPSADSRAQASSLARVTAPGHCRSARLAVSHYRARTWAWQEKRLGQLADRTPVVRGRSCHWARYVADEWAARARSARRAYRRWWAERGQVVVHLENGLAGTPMEGTGAILERYGRMYGISPYFMVATAATESSIGAAACSNNRFNVWGLASCVNSWHVPSFRSWNEAIAFYARFLSDRWPSHSTPYSFDGYAACDACWGRKVSEWMARLFHVPATTRYP